MMKKEVSYSSMSNSKNTTDVFTHVLMAAFFYWLGSSSSEWLLWGIFIGLNIIMLIGKLICYFTKVYFREDHVAFHNLIGLPQKIAYDKIIGIYDTPSATMQPIVKTPGTVRIHYLSKEGKLKEQAIAMKDHDVVYCELSARCPQVPFVASEYENPLFKKHFKYTQTKTYVWLITYIVFFIALMAGTTYWAIQQGLYEALVVPLLVLAFGIGTGVIIYNRTKKINTLFKEQK